MAPPPSRTLTALVPGIVFVVMILGFPPRVSWGVTASNDARRPNILLLMIDDQNDWIAPLHHPHAVTPHLQRLAGRGTVFSNAHCQAPLCNPSRTSLLLGLRPSTTGIYGLEPAFRDVSDLKMRPTLLQAFERQGYRTLLAGKVFHHDPHRVRDGMDAEANDLGPPTRVIPQPPRKLVPPTPEGDHPLMDWGSFPHRDSEKGDYQLASWIIDQLASTPRDKPFFLAAGFFLPHVPCHVPERWLARFPDDDRLLPTVLESDRDDTPQFSWYLHWKLPEPRLEWLRANGQYENTILIVTADHGESLGEHNYWFEHGRNAYEANSAVPLIIRAPDMRPGRGSPDVSLCDLAPSLLSHLSLDPLLPPPDERLTRGEIVPGLYSDGNLPSRAVFTEKIERSGEERVVQHKAVRMGTWKRVRRFTTLEGQLRIVGEELYDLQADPRETRNLMNDPPADAPLARLDAELLRFARADVQFADLARKLEEQRERLEREDPGAARVLKALGY